MNKADLQNRADIDENIPKFNIWGLNMKGVWPEGKCLFVIRT